MKYRIRESLTVAGIGKVDRESHVITDVKVCGLKSGNGRRYSRDALRNATRLYENARVFFDHPEGKSNARKFRERFGRLADVRPAEDGGLIANLHYNPAHPDCEQFLYLAEHDAAGMGLSHNAEGTGRREADGVLVESITKVHSVDIVDGPATTYSLFEQQDMEPLTDPAAPVETPAGDDGVSQKLTDLIAEFAAHPEMSKEEKVKKIKSLLDLMHDDDAPAEPKEDEADAELPDGEMMEQLGRYRGKAVRQAYGRLLREQRRKQATAKGLKPEVITDTFLEQLCDAPAAKVDRLIEDRRQLSVAATAEKPRNAAGRDAKPLTPKEIANTIDWNN